LENNLNTYKLKQQNIQAIQWTGDNFDELLDNFSEVVSIYSNQLIVITLDGPAITNPGWFVCRDIDNSTISVVSSKMFKALQMG
jgi:hypothetical protein